jgi:hypothetical protein
VIGDWGLGIRIRIRDCGLVNSSLSQFPSFLFTDFPMSHFPIRPRDGLRQHQSPVTSRLKTKKQKLRINSLLLPAIVILMSFKEKFYFFFLPPLDFLSAFDALLSGSGLASGSGFASGVSVFCPV